MLLLRISVVWAMVCLLMLAPAREACSQPVATPRGAEPVAAPFYGQVHALCIGIDRYRLPGIPELQWAEKDARTMAEVLEKQYGYRVEQLLGRQATRAAIRAKLEAYRETLGEDDALLVFWAGHGQTVELDSFGRAGFLLAYDSQLTLNDTRDVEQWRDEALEMHALGQLAERCRARHVLYIVDACYSGFLGRRSGAGPRADLQALVANRSRMVITAGTEDQQAIEEAALQHGIFTHFLLRILERQEAQSASELFVALRMSVAGHTKSRMLPQLREIVVENGEFVFVPQGFAPSEFADEIARINQRLNANSARATKPQDVFRAFEATDYRFMVLAPEAQREWERRFKRFEDNASLGQPWAMAGLYHCYAKGLGVERDAARAWQWARTAYDSGHPIGLEVLGQAYIGGVGASRNVLAGERLIAQAAEQQMAISRYLQAASMLGQDAPAAKQPAARQLLEASAAEGLSSALWRLGRLDLVGSPEQRKTAVARIRSAADDGLGAAQFEMYYHTARGIDGVLAPSPQEARDWLERAAANGYSPAQYQLACEYYQRHGATGRLKLPRDDALAFRWASLAADQRYVEAYKLLAYMYAFGHGVPGDINQAKDYKDRVMTSPAADINWVVEWMQAVLPVLIGDP
jgi:TPR repeat protein